MLGLVGIWFHDARIVGLHLQHFGTGVFEVETGQNMRVFHRDQLIDHEQKFFQPFVLLCRIKNGRKQKTTSNKVHQHRCGCKSSV